MSYSTLISIWKLLSHLPTFQVDDQGKLVDCYSIVVSEAGARANIRCKAKRVRSKNYDTVYKSEEELESERDRSESPSQEFTQMWRRTLG